MCALYADDVHEEAIFERLVFLIRDWEHDEEPDSLDQTVSICVCLLISLVYTLDKLKVLYHVARKTNKIVHRSTRNYFVHR